MYVIKLKRSEQKVVVKHYTNKFNLQHVGRRGLQGETGATGPQGPKGDQGDPATNLVQSVNGKQGVVVLNATDVGADASGSAAQALVDAKGYTDTEVSTLDSSLATVAKTGSYDDLSNKPTIPSIAGLATETYVDNAVAPKANTSDLGTSAFEDVEDLPVSTAIQSALDEKVSKVNQANIVYGRGGTNVEMAVPMVYNAATPLSVARRDDLGQLNVSTATFGDKAVNKAQMDAADALKVNKAGDTMTGQLQSTSGAVAYRHTRGTTDIAFSAGPSNGRAFIYSYNIANSLLEVDASGLSLGGWNSSPAILKGTGFPNGVVSAPVGSTYIDTAATNGAIEWKKATGTGNTGWVVSMGDTGWRNVTSLASSEFTIVNPNDYGYYIRRVNNEVQISIKAQTVASSWNGQSVFIPLGFRVADATTPVVLQEAYQTASTGRGQVQAGIGLILVSSTWSTAGIRFTSNIFTTTTTAWPSTLPGTPVA